MKMKYLLQVIVMLTLFSTNIFSQEIEEEKYSPKEKFALQFQISDNFTLSSFQGSTFSGKYHFENEDAVRIGFSVYGFSGENRTVNVFEPEATTVTNALNTFSFGIRCDYLFYYRSFSNSFIYFGGGPFYSTRNQEINESVLHDLDTKISDIDSQKYGAHIVFGVEWFPTKFIGISAEYGYEFYREKTERKIQYEVADGSIFGEEESRNAAANSVLFGLSVYF